MTSVFLRRGPWGWIQAGREDPPEADVVIESLLALPEALRDRPWPAPELDLGQRLAAEQPSDAASRVSRVRSGAATPV